MLDREDIIHLADMIDNIVDYTKAVIDRLHLYEIERPTRYARRMARLFLRCAESLDEIIDCLRLLSSAADLEALQEQVKRINELENEADQVKKMAAAELFRTATDPIEVIKWKEIYDYLENAINSCEDVANLIESAVVKNA